MQINIIWIIIILLFIVGASFWFGLLVGEEVGWAKHEEMYNDVLECFNWTCLLEYQEGQLPFDKECALEWVERWTEP